MVLIKMYERLAVVLSDCTTESFEYNVISDVRQVLRGRENLLESTKLTLSLFQLINQTLGNHLLRSLREPRQLDKCGLHLLIVGCNIACLVRTAGK